MAGQGAAMLIRADSLFFQGLWKDAMSEYVKYLADSSQNSVAWNRLGYADQRLGLYQDAIKNYEHSLACQPSKQVRAVVESRLARTYALMNDPAAALSWLEKAIGSGYINLAELDSSSDFQTIRNRPGFADLRKKVFNSVYPCFADPKAREFDFWIGEWDVYQTGTTIQVGRSVIQQSSGGCAILENWTSLQGHNGKSLNYRDPSSGEWEQDWIGSDGAPQRYLHGTYKDSAMRFQFESISNGGPASGHFVLFNLGPDKVRQFQELSADGGKTFQVAYDFTYVRKK
ncbi:MAG: tetratricopeptide repeat protein [Chitinophagales bacterium]